MTELSATLLDMVLQYKAHNHIRPTFSTYHSDNSSSNSSNSQQRARFKTVSMPRQCRSISQLTESFNAHSPSLPRTSSISTSNTRSRSHSSKGSPLYIRSSKGCKSRRRCKRCNTRAAATPLRNTSNTSSLCTIRSSKWQTAACRTALSP